MVDAGSFTGVTRALDMSKAAVSRYVAELEERLGGAAAPDHVQAVPGELLVNLDEAGAEITARG